MEIESAEIDAKATGSTTPQGVDRPDLLGNINIAFPSCPVEGSGLPKGGGSHQCIHVPTHIRLPSRRPKAELGLARATQYKAERNK